MGFSVWDLGFRAQGSAFRFRRRKTQIVEVLKSSGGSRIDPKPHRVIVDPGAQEQIGLTTLRASNAKQNVDKYCVCGFFGWMMMEMLKLVSRILVQAFVLRHCVRPVLGQDVNRDLTEQELRYLPLCSYTLVYTIILEYTIVCYNIY